MLRFWRWRRGILRLLQRLIRTKPLPFWLWSRCRLRLFFIWQQVARASIEVLTEPIQETLYPSHTLLLLLDHLSHSSFDFTDSLIERFTGHIHRRFVSSCDIIASCL